MLSVGLLDPGSHANASWSAATVDRLTLLPGIVAVLGAGARATASAEIVLSFEQSADFFPARLQVDRCTSASPHAAARSVAIEMSERAADEFFDAPLPVGKCYHLSTEMRQLLTALSDCAMAGVARDAYLTGTMLQLLAAAADALRCRSLIPMPGPSRLTPADSKRVMLAQEMIDDRWADKLTLDKLARECGLNRFKLTQGFRDLFQTSIHQALSERRFAEACKLLRSTDKHVALVAYEVGYSNAASFTRAFGKRFGVPPRALRETGAHPATGHGSSRR